MKRPSYSVTTGVITLLTVVAVLVKLAAPLIPPPPSNRLGAETSEYLRAAMLQQIDWRPPNATAFAEARRAQQPVLFLMGASWCTEARRFDDAVLKDLEVQQTLNRYFVCVRADVAEDPRWMQAFLPLSRAGIAFEPGLQLWLLTPEGELLASVDLAGERDLFESTRFLDRVQRLREAYEETLAGKAALPTPGIVQQGDLQELGLRRHVPEFPRPAVEAIIRAANFDTGGFPIGDRQVWRPNAFRALLAYGKSAEVEAYLDPLLGSSLVDWLDGGFFRASPDPNATRIEFDKPSRINAEIASMLAVAGAELRNPLYRGLARRTIDGLLRRYKERGAFETARIGDGDPRGRSARASFTPEQVEAAAARFGEGGLSWLQETLSLDQRRNPTMLIRVPRAKEVWAGQSERLELALDSLRKVKGTPTTVFTRRRSLEVEATVIARLLEAHRLLGYEPPQVLSDAVEGLERFRDGGTLHRFIEQDSKPYLGDYLAYSDACLQDYLSTGRVVSYERGLAALRRAKSMFSTERAGVWNTTISDANEDHVALSRVPEVVDNVGESCEARGLRLLCSYAVLEEPELAAELWSAAQKKREAYAGILVALGAQGGGLTCAAIQFTAPYKIVKTANAVEDARTLAALYPTELVVPAVGGLRKDLLFEGVYLGSGAQLQGPFSQTEVSLGRRLGRA